MDHGNAGRGLWACVRTRQGSSRSAGLLIKASTTWNWKRQHRENHKLDCLQWTWGSYEKHKRSNVIGSRSSKILKIMKQNKWEKHNDRPEIKPYFLIRHELCKVKGLLLRCRQIVIPEKLQKHVISAADSMGHFGMTKTKQMLPSQVLVSKTQQHGRRHGIKMLWV